MTPLLARDARERFISAYTLLCVSKNAAYDDVTLEAAIAVLGELPIVSVEYAVHRLAREGTHFMPSLGECFEASDSHAANALVAETEVRQLTAGTPLEDHELSSLTAARQAFVSDYERWVGKTLPSDHVWKSPTARLPTYTCLNCRDTGWRDDECVPDDQCPSCSLRDRHLYDHAYVARCVCAPSNPVLQAARAHAQRSSRLRKNIRKVGR
jgi:hypothetical protein